MSYTYAIYTTLCHTYIIYILSTALLTWFKSSEKDECCDNTLSVDDIRVYILSHIPIIAFVHGIYIPICVKYTIIPICLMYTLLPLLFGPIYVTGIYTYIYG